MDIRIGVLILVALFILLVLRVTRPPKCTRCGKVVSEFEHDECFGECQSCFLKDVPENGEPIGPGELREYELEDAPRAYIGATGYSRASAISSTRVSSYLDDMALTAEGSSKELKWWMLRTKIILRIRAGAYRRAAKFFARFRDAIPEAGDAACGARCAECKRTICVNEALPGQFRPGDLSAVIENAFKWSTAALELLKAHYHTIDGPGGQLLFNLTQANGALIGAVTRTRKSDYRLRDAPIKPRTLPYSLPKVCPVNASLIPSKYNCDACLHIAQDGHYLSEFKFFCNHPKAEAL